MGKIYVLSGIIAKWLLSRNYHNRFHIGQYHFLQQLILATESLLIAN